MEEQTLIRDVLDGNATAERALYDEHVDRVYALAYRMTRDPNEAREYTQDAFVKAFDSLSGFRGDSAFSTWLHSVTVSVILNGLRKRKRIRSREIGMEDLEPVAGGRAPVNPGLKHHLIRAVDGLTDILRVVFVLHDVEGYKHREIATMLDIPEGTSRARLNRAREALRAELSDFVLGEA